jgi:hypothetical protein
MGRKVLWRVVQCLVIVGNIPVDLLKFKKITTRQLDHVMFLQGKKGKFTIAMAQVSSW